MASLNPDSFMSSWLRLVDDPSKDVLSKITTTYTNAPKGNQTSCVDILTPLAMLHQCRLDVLSVTEGLRKAESWTALTDSQMQLSHLRLRFRKSTKEMGGAAPKHFGRMRASDAPFGRVHWEKTGARSATSSADSDGDQKMTDSEDESDEADFDEDEEDGSDMEEGQSLGAEEPAGKVGNCESDGVTNASDSARTSWTREMQKEIEVAEQYRVAMIQVLQEEIRR
ncbi:hypothetical protein GTA08_BOTSDO04279 [Botryosphaeria dothidea]|uniref:Uncharacterized protein n=1 Tax=Botryosphaeria dothidea TaxID=55169 RepID=A0A8H4IVR1_9PEZI|nr:hypothetical protein GTA08_BOTSDO04279 [Botryosphaeria dothidea]